MKVLTVFVFLNVASFVILGFSLESVSTFTPKSTISLPSPSSPNTNSDTIPKQEQESLDDGDTDLQASVNGINIYDPDNFNNSISSSDLGEEIFEIPRLLTNTHRLPDVANSWWDIRNRNMVYVDKTDILNYVIERWAKMNVCTRPRRFGKTLFSQMAVSYFSGEEHLFKGLKISKLRDGNIIHTVANGSWIRYPVIWLDFSKLHYKRGISHYEALKQFQQNLQDRLNLIAEKYGVNHSGSISLTSLIEELEIQFNLPVVVIIDEYDNPMNAAVYEDNNKLLAKDIFRVFENLCEEIKANLRIIAFVWMTGVTKLPTPSLFSSMNNHVDLSHEKWLTRIGGFTKAEIKHYFRSHLEAFSKAKNVTEKRIMETLKFYYEGYMFSIQRAERVYNPISVITALRKFEIGNFWVSTGSMDYFVEQISKNRINLEFFDNLPVLKDYIFQSYDITAGEPQLVIVMFQTGYLTIVKYEGSKCWLNFPSMEIKLSLLHALDTYIFAEGKSMDKVEWFSSLRDVLDKCDIPEAVNIINKAGFQYYKPTLDDVVKEKEVTRRIIAMLDSVGILSNQSQQRYWGNPLSGQQLKGDIDITTAGLTVDYALEIMCGDSKKQQISYGVKHLLQYISKDDETRVNFLQQLGNAYKINLLVVHVDHKSGGRIDEWVCIPYNGSKLILNDMQTSSKELFTKMESMIRNTINATHKFNTRILNGTIA